MFFLFVVFLLSGGFEHDMHVSLIFLGDLKVLSGGFTVAVSPKPGEVVLKWYVKPQNQT